MASKCSRKRRCAMSSRKRSPRAADPTYVVVVPSGCSIALPASATRSGERAGASGWLGPTVASDGCACRMNGGGADMLGWTMLSLFGR